MDFDPLTGERVLFEYDAVTDNCQITHQQDDNVVGGILERNKSLALDADLTKRGIKNDLWKYASIPNIVIMKWKQEKGVDVFNRAHRKKVFELLNDPEWRYLKTTAAIHTERD